VWPHRDGLSLGLACEGASGPAGGTESTSAVQLSIMAISLAWCADHGPLKETSCQPFPFHADSDQLRRQAKDLLRGGAFW
jgi:hypothetical protein